MGQYYYVCNLDKKEFLHPHKFGDGLKLMEFGSSGQGTMTGLAVLLADGNGRGGEDLDSDRAIVGSWKGDRIVVAGDYADNEPGQDTNLHQQCDEKPWKDISDKVIAALCDREYMRKAVAERLKPRMPGSYRSDSYPIPKELLAKLQKPIQDKPTPPHVQLAEAVLRDPDDVNTMRVFLDACMQMCGGHRAAPETSEPAKV